MDTDPQIAFICVTKKINFSANSFNLGKWIWTKNKLFCGVIHLGIEFNITFSYYWKHFNWLKILFCLIFQDVEARRLKRGHVLAELLETERIYVAEMGSILKVCRFKYDFLKCDLPVHTHQYSEKVINLSFLCRMSIYFYTIRGLKMIMIYSNEKIMTLLSCERYFGTDIFAAM